MAGITFSEVMSGGFSLGEIDPREGVKKGEAQGDLFAIHAEVSIDDMDRFVADPKHLGGLTGSVDFTPFGEGLAGTGPGVFNLFKPDDRPGMKLMVYELPFAHGGTSYYMAGAKEIKDARGIDLWSDTTTLYTRLHEGGKEGPVVGAGVLSLGVRELIALLKTVKTPGAENAAQTAATLAKFGKFFLGELWDTYVRHVPGMG